MAMRPIAWRVLAVLSGPCLDAGAAPDDVGAVGELADMVGLGAEVCVCQCHQPRRSGPGVQHRVARAHVQLCAAQALTNSLLKACAQASQPRPDRTGTFTDQR